MTVGARGAVYGPWICVAERCVLIDTVNTMYSHQILCMHVHAMVPGQRVYG
jgi:hypothetical protein